MEKFLAMLAALKLSPKEIRTILVLVSIAFLVYLGYDLYSNKANQAWVEIHLDNPNVKSIEVTKEKILIQKFSPKEKVTDTSCGAGGI